MTELYDTLLTATASAGLSMQSDRNAGHSMTMRLWGSRETTPHQGVRAQVGCQWLVLSIDAINDTSTVLVRSTTAPERHALWARSQDSTRVTFPDYGSAIVLTVHIAAMMTPSSDIPQEWRKQLKAGADGTARPPGQGLAYRNGLVPVPEERLDTWVTSKFQRVGIEGDITVAPFGAATIRRDVTHIARVQITTSHTPAAEDLVRTGMGKKRAFGLGLVLWDMLDR